MVTDYLPRYTVAGDWTPTEIASLAWSVMTYFPLLLLTLGIFVLTARGLTSAVASAMGSRRQRI